MPGYPMPAYPMPYPPPSAGAASSAAPIPQHNTAERMRLAAIEARIEFDRARARYEMVRGNEF
eukprot:6185923-Pleurochrysis_carterae.AAC.1